MDSEQLESKLKKIANKNRKLLESVSTHLINNPDELEGKLHEHRFLQQKYNELIGFSRENVDRFEKLQATLLEKDEEIFHLSRLVTESKDQAVHRIEAMERENRRRRERDESQLSQKNEQIRSLRQELALKEQKTHQLEAQLEKTRAQLETTSRQSEQTAREAKRVQSTLRQHVKSLEQRLQHFQKEAVKMEEENKKLRGALDKKKKLEVMEGLQGMVSSYRRKENH